MKYTLILFVFAMIFASCGGENQKKIASNQNDPDGITNIIALNSITPVFNTNKEEFQLRGDHARLVRTERGTRIHIPTKAFVNKITSEPIEGDVVLTFDEFHTQGEILASGIPMTYATPEGDTVDFESAGMFDIRAFQDGIELDLAEGKEIQVELASDADGTFEFYAFNEGEENWELKETECIVMVNPYIAKQKMELEKLENEMPQTPKKLIEYEKGDPLFDIKRYGAQDEVLDALNGVFWMFTGDSTQIDPSKGNAAFNKYYDFVELLLVDSSNVREYDMVFQDGTEEVTVRAAPIFQGKLLTRENDRMSRIINQIEYAMRSKADIERELEQEKAMMRMMNIEGMGIYNYDRQVMDEDAIPFIAEFTFEGEPAEKGVAIYLLPREKRCVIKYTPLTYGAFRLNPNESNRIIAILEDNTMYTISSQAIRNMKLARKKPADTVIFDMKKQGNLIEDAAEVDELIATL